MDQASCQSFISVIVPVYNVAAYLERCVYSVLRQDYPSFELILVDDGSTDGSSTLCDTLSELDNRIRVIHKANGGLSDARNAGISICSGDYVTFIDSDDWVDPQYLSILHSLLVSNNADVSVCGIIRESSSPKISAVFSMPSYTVFSSSDYLNIFFRKSGNRTIHYACGKLYRRELLDVDQFPIGMLNEDVESMFFVLTHSSIIVETELPLYHYYINPLSITESSFGNNYLNLTSVWEHLNIRAAHECPKYELYMGDLQYNIIRTYFTILVDSILHGDRQTDKVYQNEIQENRNLLRANLVTLLSGPMRIDRKAMCAAICFAYKPIRNLYRTFQHFRNW